LFALTAPMAMAITPDDFDQVSRANPTLSGQIVKPLPGQLVPLLPGQLTKALPGQVVGALPGQLVSSLPGQVVSPLIHQYKNRSVNFYRTDNVAPSAGAVIKLLRPLIISSLKK
jgi:hypothetical protein